MAAEPAPSEGSSEELQEGPATRQTKRPRLEEAVEGGSSLPRSGEAARDAAAGVVQGFFRKWQKKTSRGPRGARRLGENQDAPMELESSSSGDELPPQPPAVARRVVPEPASSRAEAQAGANAPSHDVERPHRYGKVPTEGKGRDFTPAGWPSPYYLAESEVGAWAKVRDLMIGRLPPNGSREEEPDSEHRFDPASRMDVRSSVFKSRYIQAKAVEQFSLPNDEELLKAVPDVGLHVILRSYLTRGCLVEQEIYRRLAQGHHAYEKLRKVGVEPGVAENAELDQVVADLSAKQAELDDWRREMEVKERLIADLKASDSNKSAEIQQLRRRLQQGGQGTGSTGSISEALQERDLAMTQVMIEKQIAQHAKSQLEEEMIVKQKLQDRCAQLERSLSLAENKVSYLESSVHESVVMEKNRSAVIEEYRQSAMGKIEVALACKAGSDYVMAQQSSGVRELAGRLRYPPSIADHIDLLARVEEAGGGYDVGEGRNEDEPEAAPEGVEEGNGRGSAEE